MSGIIRLDCRKYKMKTYPRHELFSWVYVMPVIDLWKMMAGISLRENLH